MDFNDFDISEFKIVVQGIRAVTNAEIRICPSKIAFNAMAAAEMNYPAFVHMFISADASRVIITPCHKGENLPSPSIKRSAAGEPVRC